jgi:hypothetical protein
MSLVFRHSSKTSLAIAWEKRSAEQVRVVVPFPEQTNRMPSRSTTVLHSSKSFSTDAIFSKDIGPPPGREMLYVIMYGLGWGGGCERSWDGGVDNGVEIRGGADGGVELGGVGEGDRDDGLGSIETVILVPAISVVRGSK